MAATRIVVVALALALPAVLAGGALAAPAPGHRRGRRPRAPASILRDSLGIPHISARSDHDAYFLVGWLHARDRLFQMDQGRRQASGTLAELLGPRRSRATSSCARSG